MTYLSHTTQCLAVFVTFYRIGDGDKEETRNVAPDRKQKCEK